MGDYYPDYVPEGGEAAFNDMLSFLRTSETPEMFKDRTMLFILHEETPRQDIMVAIGRVEREKGWR